MGLKQVGKQEGQDRASSCCRALQGFQVTWKTPGGFKQGVGRVTGGERVGGWRVGVCVGSVRDQHSHSKSHFGSTWKSGTRRTGKEVDLFRDDSQWQLGQ